MGRLRAGVSNLVCPECASPMVLRNSKWGKFYGCSRFPVCKATHGAHSGGSLCTWAPPVDEETRQARIKAHKAFDRLWKNSLGDLSKARRRAYRWLQSQLGLSSEECHIARFDRAMCNRVIELLQEQQRKEGK